MHNAALTLQLQVMLRPHAPASRSARRLCKLRGLPTQPAALPAQAECLPHGPAPATTACCPTYRGVALPTLPAVLCCTPVSGGWGSTTQTSQWWRGGVVATNSLATADGVRCRLQRDGVLTQEAPQFPQRAGCCPATQMLATEVPPTVSGKACHRGWPTQVL